MDIKRNIRNKRSAFVSQKNSQPIKNSSYISGLFTRTLISVIFVLLCAIFVNMSDKNLLLFKDYFFNNTLEFTKINELYKTYFGNIIWNCRAYSCNIYHALFTKRHRGVHWR